MKTQNSEVVIHKSRQAPNQALQRTATGCHGPCFLRSGFLLHLVPFSALVAVGQGPRQPSAVAELDSLGVCSRLVLQ